MKNKRFLYNVYFAVAAIIMIAATVLRGIAVTLHLDYESGYFTDKLYIGIADKLVLLGIVFAISYLFAASKTQSLMFKFESPMNYVFSGTAGAALLSFSVHLFSVFKEKKDFVDKYGPIRHPDTASQRIVMYIAFFAAVMALASVFHFLLASINVGRRSTRRADFGLVMVLFLALYAAYLYFNTKMPINSPAKVIDQMAYLCASIFFLYETRISIGRERWRAYSAFGFAAMILTAYSSIPALAAYLSSGEIISDSIYESILTFTLFLFITARLILLIRLPEDKTNRTVDMLRQMAYERDLELAPPKEETSEADSSDEVKEEYYELNFEAEPDGEMLTSTTEAENEENTGY